MAGNRRCANSLFREKRRAEQGNASPHPLSALPKKATSSPPPNLVFPGVSLVVLEAFSRSGEQARSETRSALSNLPARALPLSYRPLAKPGGIRTRDPVIKDVTGLFTTGAASGSGERSRTERRLVSQGSSSFEEAPEPASQHPVARDASTVRNQPTPPMGKLVWSEVSFLFTTALKTQQGASRGTDGAALFSTKKSAPSPPGTSKSPSVSSSGTPRGSETKNPSGASLGRGSEKPNWKRPQPIPPPRESTRLLPHRS
jgi:hypothetical protein